MHGSKIGMKTGKFCLQRDSLKSYWNYNIENVVQCCFHSDFRGKKARLTINQKVKIYGI